MAASPDDLFAFLDRLGIPHATVTHAPLFTVEQSQNLRGSIAGAHTKNLFLRDKKGALVLLTALEDAGIPPSTIAGSDVGVYIGACQVEYGHRFGIDHAVAAFPARAAATA